MSKKQICACVVMLTLWGSATYGAFDFGKVLDGLLSGNRARREALEREAKEARNRLNQDISDFKKRKSALAPEQAAAEWLALFDRAYPVAPVHSIPAFTLNSPFSELVEALPRPAAWPELERLVLMRDSNAPRDVLVRVFIFRLTGKYDALAQDLAQLGNDIDSDYVRSVHLELLPRISRFRGMEAEGYAQLLELLEREPKPDFVRSNDLVVPDLVKLIERDAAASLIKRSLALPSINIEVPSEGDTLRLVKQLIIEEIESLGSPQWKLVTSPNDDVLFELMEDKFPIPKEQDSNRFSVPNFSMRMDYTRQQAMRTYVLGLIQRGQWEKALDYVSDLDPAALNEFDRLNDLTRNISIARLGDLRKFYESVLQARPTAPVRTGLFKCVLLSGDTEQAIAEVSREIAQADVTSEQGIGARAQLASICLALDDMDRALGIYDELFQLELDGLSTDAVEKLVDVGKSTLRLSVLLDDEALVEKCVGWTLKAGRELDERKAEQGFQIYSWKSELIEQLVAMKRYDQALAFGLEWLAEEEKKQQERLKEFSFNFSFSLGGSSLIVELMAIHNAMGEHEKAVALLEESTLWNKADLADVVRSSYGSADEVLYQAAAALNAVGRGPEAFPLLEAQLYREPAHDPSYRLLLDMKGPDALPFLDKLVRRDRFEERPLIWKAVLLQEQGRLAEAEDIIRAALSVDPTDGEQRAGDRVRAYAVLAEILAERGDQENAAFFEDVVKSVRIAEEGDRMQQAGLVLRGIKAYEKAEGLFADAYCVQWRLAERLYSMGRIEEAKKHYEIAFKRLPEQFGQVASFCFGCEGVFESEHTRSIAERVLLDLEKTSPDRPQLHYLLGQLRMKQGRANTAYQHLEKAVALDPDYLDAWDMLNDLSPRLSISPQECDVIQLKLLELDPLQRHSSVSVEEVSDLAALWRALEQSAAHRFEMPEKLFNLSAAEKYLSTHKDPTGFDYSPPGLDRDDDSPETMIAEDEIVDAIGSLLDDVTNQ